MVSFLLSITLEWKLDKFCAWLAMAKEIKITVCKMPILMNILFVETKYFHQKYYFWGKVFNY